MNQTIFRYEVAAVLIGKRPKSGAGARVEEDLVIVQAETTEEAEILYRRWYAPFARGFKVKSVTVTNLDVLEAAQA